jgi:hypothetical protein
MRPQIWFLSGGVTGLHSWTQTAFKKLHKVPVSTLRSLPGACPALSCELCHLPLCSQGHCATRTLGLSSASRATAPGAQWASVPPCPHLPQCQLHSWCFAIVEGAAWGRYRRGWALGTGAGTDRLWSAVSMQVTSAGTATRPARPRTEWQCCWAPGPITESPPAHTELVALCPASWWH